MSETFRVLESTHGLVLVSSPSTPIPFPVAAPVDVSIVCGDLVALDETRSRIVEVAARRTALVRARMDGDEHKGAQVICANADIVAICVPLDRPVSERFIERALAVVHASGARPLVVLTKRDAVDEVPELAMPGVDVVAVCALSRDASDAGDASDASDASDIDVVRAFLAPGEVMALLGASGAGKSTLANALLGAATQDVGAVRAGDARGRHTTSGARLLALPAPRGAFLVDTAGIRTLGLRSDGDDDIGAAVSAAFPDIDALATSCRFRDCRHGSEPGCAVRAAVDDGTLDDTRLQSFHGLMREAARRARPPWRRGDERALAIAGWRRARDKRR